MKVWEHRYPRCKQCPYAAAPQCLLAHPNHASMLPFQIPPYPFQLFFRSRPLYVVYIRERGHARPAIGSSSSFILVRIPTPDELLNSVSLSGNLVLLLPANPFSFLMTCYIFKCLPYVPRSLFPLSILLVTSAASKFVLGFCVVYISHRFHSYSGYALGRLPD